MALKCKSSNTGPAKPPCHPHHTSPDQEEDEATEPDPIDTEDDEPVDPDMAYEETKALSEADYNVSVHYSSNIFI